MVRYVSVVITCPYSGKVDSNKVKEVARALFDMGCYEVSLGDTVGTGNPTSIRDMLETVMGGSSGLPAGKLAVSLILPFCLGFSSHYPKAQFPDTFGTAVANVVTALDMGIRTVDSAVGGLGGCPYSPGATGNVATEDIIYALKDSRYIVPGDLDTMVDIGVWISDLLGRQNASRAGRAITARKERERKKIERGREKHVNVAETVSSKL